MFGKEPQEPIGQTQESSQMNEVPYYQAGEEIGKLMLDSSSLIKKVRLQLLGYALDNDGVYQQEGDRLMNNKGVATVIVLLESLATKEAFLTKISDEDAVRITRDVWNTLIRLIVKNRDEWELPDDPGKWSLIRSIIINQVYFALRRGVDGTEKHFFADTTKMQTNTNTTSQQQYQKRGFF